MTTLSSALLISNTYYVVNARRIKSHHDLHQRAQVKLRGGKDKWEKPCQYLLFINGSKVCLRAINDVRFVQSLSVWV